MQGHRAEKQEAKQQTAREGENNWYCKIEDALFCPMKLDTLFFLLFCVQSLKLFALWTGIIWKKISLIYN